MERTILYGVSVLFLATLLAAPSVAQLGPLGPMNNGGWIPPDVTKKRCEAWAVTNAARLMKCIAGCRKAAATALLSNKTFDETACVEGPTPKQTSCLENYNKGNSRTTILNICATTTCIDDTSVHASVEAMAAAVLPATYCSGGTAFGANPRFGGSTPPDEATKNCENRALTNAAALMTCIASCRDSAASSLVKNLAFDEKTCVEGPTPKETSCFEKYDKASSKLATKASCATANQCLDAAGIRATVDSSVAPVLSGAYCNGVCGTDGLRYC
ncbi:MAG: hypothetical protein HY270_11220, partial [Deltaproteobacteria bacterium]|nr:hypothetical protein [Deltaproteobacteria bacterium]